MAAQVAVPRGVGSTGTGKEKQEWDEIRKRRARIVQRERSCITTAGAQRRVSAITAPHTRAPLAWRSRQRRKKRERERREGDESARTVARTLHAGVFTCVGGLRYVGRAEVNRCRPYRQAQHVHTHTYTRTHTQGGAQSENVRGKRNSLRDRRRSGRIGVTGGRTDKAQGRRRRRPRCSCCGTAGSGGEGRGRGEARTPPAHRCGWPSGAERGRRVACNRSRRWRHAG